LEKVEIMVKIVENMLIFVEISIDFVEILAISVEISVGFVVMTDHFIVIIPHFIVTKVYRKKYSGGFYLDSSILIYFQALAAILLMFAKKSHRGSKTIDRF
jgi:hypothetical protein